jgi:hypothetical protein
VAYLQNHHIIYSYLKKKDDGSDIFIHDFVYSSCSALLDDAKQIDIICSLTRLVNSNHDTPDEEHYEFDTDNFKKLGVSKIQLFQRQESGEFKLIEEIGGEGGKVLRLINPLGVDNADAKILAKASYLCVGCTGDLSLSEALSYDKLPWYQIVHHKQRVFYALQNLVQENIPGARHSHLGKFLTKLPYIGKRNADPELPGECMRAPETHQQTKQMCELVKTQYCFNKILIDIVYREQARQKYPACKKYEDELTQQFIQRKISLSEGYDQMDQFISKLACTLSLE